MALTGAFQSGAIIITGEAGAALTAKQYHIIELNSDGAWDVADTDNGSNKLHGVLLTPTTTTAPVNTIAAGDKVDILILGETKIFAGAAIEEGVAITTDSTGQAVTGTTSGDFVLGCAIEPAAADSDIVKVFFNGSPSQAN